MRVGVGVVLFSDSSVLLVESGELFELSGELSKSLRGVFVGVGDSVIGILGEMGTLLDSSSPPEQAAAISTIVARTSAMAINLPTPVELWRASLR